MPDESCIHCGQPAEADDRETAIGRVHERCWEAFQEKKPVAISSVVAGIFGFSMVAAGAVVLSVGLAALSMASALDRNSQNILEGIVSLILWFVALGVAIFAIPAGAIMLLIAFFTWVVTNNNAFKNYVALGLVAIVVVILGFSTDFRENFDKLVSRFNPAYVVPEEPDFETECISRRSSISQGTYYRDVVHCRGVETEFYADGQKKSEASYGDPKVSRSDTAPNGTCFPKERKSPKQLYACSVREGMSTTWYPNGQMKSEMLFANGVPARHFIDWYENGHKMHEQKLLGDPWTRTITDWYENGQMKSRVTQLEGEVNWSGTCETWYKDGRKFQVGKVCLYPDE